MEIQLTEFLIDTVEKLLRIVRQQNSTLAQLGAVAAEDQLQEVALALAAVAEDQDVARCLVLCSSVKVNKDVRSVLISSDIQAVGIGLT